MLIDALFLLNRFGFRIVGPNIGNKRNSCRKHWPIRRCCPHATEQWCAIFTKQAQPRQIRAITIITQVRARLIRWMRLPHDIRRWPPLQHIPRWMGNHLGCRTPLRRWPACLGKIRTLMPIGTTKAFPRFEWTQRNIITPTCQLQCSNTRPNHNQPLPQIDK